MTHPKLIQLQFQPINWDKNIYNDGGDKTLDFRTLISLKINIFKNNPVTNQIIILRVKKIKIKSGLKK